MSIIDVVLFISSTSQACGPPFQFIRQSHLPVRIVRLDTVVDRQVAARGRYFQIHSVPTLLVTYEDGNIQLFNGQEKVMMWLQQAINASAQRNLSTPTHTSVIESSDEEEEEKPKKQKRHSKKKSGGKKKPVTDESEDEPRVKSKKKKKTVVFEDKPRGSKGLYDGKSKKKKKPPVELIEDESGNSEEDIDIVFVDDEHRPPPPSTAGLVVGPAATTKRKSQMTDVFEYARQMEKERQATLGYREDDLPKS